MKLRRPGVVVVYHQSPPTRGRGLKLLRRRMHDMIDIVAPHAGARIETRTGRRSVKPKNRRPPRGGAD